MKRKRDRGHWKYLHRRTVLSPIWWGIKRWWPSSVCLSVPCLTLSREWKGIASWKLVERNPGNGWSVTPFRGREIKGRGNKVTSQNSFSHFRSEARSWWHHLPNKFANTGASKITQIRCATTHRPTCIFPYKFKDLKWFLNNPNIYFNFVIPLIYHRTYCGFITVAVELYPPFYSHRAVFAALWALCSL